MNLKILLRIPKIMVTGHNNSPLLIVSGMSPFQTVLFKIFFFCINYHDKIYGCNFTKLTGMESV